MINKKNRALSSTNSQIPILVICSPFYLASIFVFFFLVVPTVACAANSCVTADCHPGLINKSSVHEPATEDCLNCHQRKVEAHPVKGEKSFALVAEGMALCSRCHDDSMVKGKFGHGPAVMGSCLECHEVHSSGHKHLLRQEEPELCFKCHQDFSAGMKKAAVVHDPVTSQPCTSCHNPHSSSFESLLKGKMEDICAECHEEIGDKVKKAKTKHMPLYRKEACGSCHLIHFGEHKKLLQFPEKELCLDCHGKDDNSKANGLKNIKKELEGKKHLHGPIKEDKCSVCHDPHGSANPRLLTGIYPTDFYANYKPGIYGFCLGCHEENLLRFAETTINTEFRNGNNNLHYVHSARKLKGRTCRTCHEPHASDWDKLITAEGTSFGSWKIPIRFVLMENGGSCSPGCHQTQLYDRVHPVDYGNGKKESGAGEKGEGKKDAGKKGVKKDKGEKVVNEEALHEEGLGEKESLGEKEEKSKQISEEQQEIKEEPVPIVSEGDEEQSQAKEDPASSPPEIDPTEEQPISPSDKEIPLHSPSSR